MSLPHADSGEIVHLRDVVKEAENYNSRALVKSDRFETMVVQLEKGKGMGRHAVTGPVTVQCLSGNIRFALDDVNRDLQAGDWMYLAGDTPHSVEALEDCVVLLTVVFDENAKTEGKAGESV